MVRCSLGMEGNDMCGAGCGQVEIILVKSEHFDELMAAAAEERELAPEDDQAEP